MDQDEVKYPLMLEVITKDVKEPYMEQLVCSSMLPYPKRILRPWHFSILN